MRITSTGYSLIDWLPLYRTR